MLAMVHDNTQLPRIETAGLPLGPGQHYKWSYTKQTIFFLPSPYTTCSTKVTPGMQAMFDQFQDTDYTYSQIICYGVCTQAYV